MDGAPCFASYHYVPFIYNLNTEIRDNNKATMINWIYTDIQTGKNKLDTHVSFLNSKFKSYVEDGNGIAIEKDIARVVSFADGVQGTTAKLIDASSVGSQKFINKTLTKAKTKTNPSMK